jgi:hypothetical protein
MSADEPGPVMPEASEAAGARASSAKKSALLEEVALGRGLEVRRLDEEIAVCSDGQRRVMFHGSTSSSSAKLADALCGNDAWLRGHLARHGLPVVPTRLVGADDADFALAAAESLGFPVRMRLADGQGRSVGGGTHAVTDADSFHLAWGGLTRNGVEPHARVLLEAALAGAVARVWVVADEAILTSLPDQGLTPQARELAVRAVEKLPGTSYGVVSLALTKPGPLVSGIALSTTVADPEARSFIGAVLDAELRCDVD